MCIESFIVHYGYLAILGGVFLEGETVLILAGFMAHRGYLNLTLVISIAYIGAFLYTQLFYILGRNGEVKFIERNPRRKIRADRIRAIMSSHETLGMIGFRFIYGTRTIAPFLFGLSESAPRRFTYLNLIGALLWTIIYGFLGYSFGHICEILIEDLEKHEIWIAVGLILLSFMIFLFHKLKPVRLLSKNPRS